MDFSLVQDPIRGNLAPELRAGLWPAPHSGHSEEEKSAKIAFLSGKDEHFACLKIQNLTVIVVTKSGFPSPYFIQFYRRSTTAAFQLYDCRNFIKAFIAPPPTTTSIFGSNPGIADHFEKRH
ncbi:hypothetical protein Ddc_11156 [Ditylenchus destructor]|nr:hypothetical protein Ddc_11156 [Ditylenchus destructor]